MIILEESQTLKHLQYNQHDNNQYRLNRILRPFSPAQNRSGRSSSSGQERSPCGGEQPAAGQCGQGCGTAAGPEHPSDRDHL